MPTQPKKPATTPPRSARKRRERKAVLRAFWQNLTPADRVTLSNLMFEEAAKAETGAEPFRG